jgi:hypothetical protein
MKHRWSKAERQAHNTTLETLCGARDQQVYHGTVWFFLHHASTHCLEQWFSERYGYEVRITDDENGVQVTRVG